MINKKFFRLLDDINAKGRWYLGNMRQKNREYVLPIEFLQGRLYTKTQPVFVEVYQDGEILDFTVAVGVFIVSHRVATFLNSLLGQTVQWVEVIIEGKNEPFFIVNILNVIDCIVITDPTDPKTSAYGFTTIDSNKIPNGIDIFNVKGYENITIVTEELKNILLKADFVGFDIQDIQII